MRNSKHGEADQPLLQLLHDGGIEGKLWEETRRKMGQPILLGILCVLVLMSTAQTTNDNALKEPSAKWVQCYEKV